MASIYNLTIEEAVEIIAFIRMHEREEIGDELWEIQERLFDFINDNSF